jgi:hypothetical protein
MQGEVGKKSCSPAHAHPRKEEDPQCYSKQHHFNPFVLNEQHMKRRCFEQSA